MAELSHSHLEERLSAVGATFVYPPTPDVARRLPAFPARPMLAARRRWALALALFVLALIAGLGAVPGVRAAVLEFLQLGGIRIFLPAMTPTPTNAPGAGSSGLATGEVTPTPVPAVSALNLAGATTLEEARTRADFPIKLPGYPVDLGLPDQVYYQHLEGQIVLLVWHAPAQPESIRLSLMLLGPNAFIGKSAPPSLEHTTVAGQPALWLHGTHPLWLETGEQGYQEIQLTVTGNVLIWEDGEATYRLESSLPMEEARRVAESIVTSSVDGTGAP